MELRHYYSGCILLHCSGTLTHILNCTLPGFSISFVHFQSVYIIESLHMLMYIVSRLKWITSTKRLRYLPAVIVTCLLNMQIIHKQHNGFKLGLWCTLPLWFPPSFHSFIQWDNTINCSKCWADMQMTLRSGLKVTTSVTTEHRLILLSL